MWHGVASVVQQRVGQLSVELARYGLRLSPDKCQLYMTSNVPLINRARVVVQESLEVTGITMRVGMSIYDLLLPLQLVRGPNSGSASTSSAPRVT